MSQNAIYKAKSTQFFDCFFSHQTSAEYFVIITLLDNCNDFHTFLINFSSPHFWLLFINFNKTNQGDTNWDSLENVRLTQFILLYLYLEPSSNACIKQTAKYSTWFLSVDCTSHMIDLASKLLNEAQHAWKKLTAIKKSTHIISILTSSFDMALFQYFWRFTQISDLKEICSIWIYTEYTEYICYYPKHMLQTYLRTAILKEKCMK